MQKRGFARLALAAFFCLTVQAVAATPAKPLPDRIAAHISIQSVEILTANVFQLIDTSTRGTKNHVPAEFLEMLSQMYLPLPLDTWKSDEPTHIMVVNTLGDYGPVVIVSAASFDELVGRLENIGWEFTNSEDEPAALEVMVEGQPMLLTDLGGGRAALGRDMDDIALAAKNSAWTPEHLSPAHIAANISVRREFADMAENFTRALDRNFDQAVASLREAGVSAAAAEGIMTLGRKYLPRLGAELDKATNILVELTIEEDGLVLDVGGCFADGAYLKRVTEHLQTQPVADSPLTAWLPGEPLSVAVNPSMMAALPDAERISSAALDDFLAAFPSQGDALRDSYRRFNEAGPGAAATANYFRDGKQSQYTIIGMRDAAAGFDAMVAGLEGMAKTLAGFFADPAERVELVSESHSADGFSWVTFSPQAADREKFERLVERLNRINGDISFTMQFDADMRIHLARLDDPSALVFSMGPVEEDEFLDLLRNTEKREEDWFAALGSQKTLAGLENAQLARGLMDADQLYFLFTAQSIFQEAHGSPSDSQRHALDVLRRMADRLEKKDADIGVSLGAADGWLQMRMIVPARAVNAIIHDYENFQTLLRRERRKVEREAIPEEEEMEDDEEDVGAA